MEREQTYRTLASLVILLSCLSLLLLAPEFSPRWVIGGAFLVGLSASSLLSYLSSRAFGGRKLRLLYHEGHALLERSQQLRAGHLNQAMKDSLQAAEHNLEAALQRRDPALMHASQAALDAALSLLPSSSRVMLREVAEILGLAFLLAITLKTCVIEPFQIPSASMFPTLHVGDHVFVNKFIYGVHLPWLDARLLEGLRLPARGEIIVFRRTEEIDYIKRVVGLPGDVIEVDEREVRVNGVLLSKEALGDLTWDDTDSLTEKPIQRESLRFTEQLDEHPHEVLYDPIPSIMPARRWVVPPGEYMVLGDNRDHSLDSRSWGFVPLHDIKGRGLFVWWSSDASGVKWERLGLGLR